MGQQPWTLESPLESTTVEPGSNVSSYHVSGRARASLLSSGASPDTWQFSIPQVAATRAAWLFDVTLDRGGDLASTPSLKRAALFHVFFFFLIRARLREMIREILYRSESSFFFFLNDGKRLKVSFKLMNRSIT